MDNSKIIKIKNDIFWAGILDPDLKTFDIVLETQYGTTYNSYFIDAEKKAVIDTAKEKFKDEYIEKIKKLTPPEEIKYIIVNHTEPDHAGCIKHLLKIAPDAVVVGSGNAIRYLADIVGFEFKSQRVKDGDIIDLGNKKLRVIGAPNLHWPDTIYTYLEEDRILFSCDSFGAHYCHQDMFDDLVPNFDEAFKYYFDVILKPYSRFMVKAVDKIKDLPIEMICTGHGPILRTHWQKYVDLSYEYAMQEVKKREADKNKVLIAYVSAYGYTRQMAELIAAGIKEFGNLEVDLLDIESLHFDELSEILSVYQYLVLGSPTINQNVPTPVYTFFSALNPIRDKGKGFAAFGSYGWSGEAVSIIENALSTIKLRKLMDGLMVKFSPLHNREEVIEFGRSFARKVQELNKE